jgi:hypothetical protein
MPFQFYCRKCGALLLEVGEELIRFHSSCNSRKCNSYQASIERFIIRKIGDKCPHCGNKLSTKPTKIEVYPIRQTQLGNGK